MMHALYVLHLVKGTSRDEATSNSEQIKPVALSIVELCLAGISSLFNQRKILLNRKS